MARRAPWSGFRPPVDISVQTYRGSATSVTVRVHNHRDYGRTFMRVVDSSASQRFTPSQCASLVFRGSDKGNVSGQSWMFTGTRGRASESELTIGEVLVGSWISRLRSPGA